MKLPDKIKVGNIVYEIRRKSFNKYLLGVHRYKNDKAELLLHEKLTGQKLRNIFFHELTHAILVQIGADKENDNEMFVQSLANELDKLFELKE